MAKKAQKGKSAKKAAKPAKKATAKKSARKTAPKKASKAAKKATPKKVSKPAKKAIAKKIVKKATPKKATKTAKKIVAKKVVAKKATPKKVTKKVVAKKPVKKAIAKKVAKKVTPKKIAAKKVIPKKTIAKTIVKIIAKPIAKPIAKVEAKSARPIGGKVIFAKPIAATKPLSKKKEREMDLDDDGKSNKNEEPMIVEYRTPAIRKPMGPAPKPHVNTDTRTRYSDNELKEFKQLILKKLEEAQKDYELLKSTLSHKDDHGTDDTSPTFKLLEDGSDVLSKEETAHLAGRQEKFIQNLQNALIRIENKTYGICRATGKLISKERLRSVPHATLAIEAKLVQNA